MDRASVHAVIVNWNSGAQLRQCLRSFAAAAGDDVAARVTVIDNASADGSCDALEAPVPLTVVRNSDNRGFGAACNQGAVGSDADFILFLNPDTRLMPGSYIGFCSAVLGSSIPPRFVPSFSFWTDKGLAPYDLDKAKQVMKAVYARRDLRWTDADERMVTQVLETAPKVEKLGPREHATVAGDAASREAVTALSP